MNTDPDSPTLGAVTAVSRAFDEALSRLQSWRKNRKNRRSGESELQDSLESGRDDLKAEYYKLNDANGEDFERGDEISRASLFRIANDIQRTITDVIAKAELSHGFGQPELNPSDLWQKSEKIRKAAALCLSELVMRIKTGMMNRSSFINISNTTTTNPRTYGSTGSIPTRPLPPLPTTMHHAPSYNTYDREYETPHSGYYPPPAQYSPEQFPVYTQPVYHQPQYEEEPEYDEPEYDEPPYVVPASNWRGPQHPSPPRRRSPPTPPAHSPNSYGLPPSLQIGISSGGRPQPFVQRPRPSSVSMTGTGYISRVATSSPFTEPLAQRPFASVPAPRPAVHERNSYGFDQSERGHPDGRRATVGYTKPMRFEADVMSRAWSPEPPILEQPWIPKGAIYTPISPPTQDFLNVSAHGHFRMPTPVNHGGQEFGQR